MAVHTEPMHQLRPLQTSLVPVKSVVEKETKLAVQPDFRLPTLSGRPLPRRVFTSTYFDTLDHCLARLNITLRLRIENGLSAWQLKLPLEGARREVEVRDTSRTPPTRIVEALVVILQGKHLVPVASLRNVTDRRSRASRRTRHGRRGVGCGVCPPGQLRRPAVPGT